MAVPNPERELQRLDRYVQAGLGPVSVVTGASEFFRGEALARLLAAVPAARELRTVDGQIDAGDGRELQDLCGGGLFGGGTWLCVRRADKWLAAHGDEVLRVLPQIAHGCGLLIEATKLDKRTKLGKALAATASFELRDLYAEPYDRSRSPLEAELVQWVGQRGRSIGVKLAPESAYLLVTTVGKDPARLAAELQRLAERGGDGGKRPLQPDDLRGALTVAFESTPFELAEALLDGDRARCLRAIAAMFDRGIKGRDGATMDRGGVFPFVASWLFQALGSAHRGRLLLDSGVPLGDVPARAGVRVFADRFQRQVRRNPEPRLRRGLQLVRTCQRRLRDGGEDPRWLLERLVVEYCAVAAAEAAP